MVKGGGDGPSTTLFFKFLQLKQQLQPFASQGTNMNQ